MIDTNAGIDLELLAPVIEQFSGRNREALLPFLHEAQSIYGWLPPEVQQAAGETLRVPLADVHGVIEFYTMFYREPTARRVIRICEDPACHLAGSAEVIAETERMLALASSQTSQDGNVAFERVPCLGMCELAPAALNGEDPAGNLDSDGVASFLAGEHPKPHAKVYGDPLWILGRLGKVDPADLDDYIRYDGYKGLRKALTLEPDSLLDLIEQSEVLGRGGAMFPAGRKWRFTRAAAGNPSRKHIIVNGDESEPGTFKDRCIMEEDPFSVVEAATIAAYAVGAENGWIFVRGEYPRSYERLAEAVRQARSAGFLGRDILGRDGFHFDIELRLGAGAYICGEETALFEAIEGKRGFPRIKPPFPVTHGLFMEPTAINNVETLVAILAALNVGVEDWRSKGSDESKGTKLFCVSGHIARPGLYELPFGVTIRELITMAGGVPGDHAIQAVLMGGAAGVFIGPEELDLPLTYEDTRAGGVPLGSGVVMVFDDTADLRQALYQLARFFTHESCGKCFPCQLGTQRQSEILFRIAQDGDARRSDRRNLTDLGHAMTETSLCGLGQTAASAVMSAIDRWPELVE